MNKDFRIAIIGPEATGKTELAETLAAFFGGVATEEYARFYFQQRRLPAEYVLDAEEMREVMRGQHRAEQGGGLRFIDASCIHGPLYAAMTRDVSGRLVFDAAGTDAEIMDYATGGGYDAFILCRPHAGLPWEDDGMRAMPDLRDRVAFADACMAFIGLHYPQKPCIVVDADDWETRTRQAIEGIGGIAGRWKESML